MKVILDGILLGRHQGVSGKGKAFETIKFADRDGGECQFYVADGMDVSKVPTMVPLKVELTVLPHMSGFSTSLTVTNIANSK